MPDMLLTLGLDDRGVMKGLRGLENKASDASKGLKLGAGVQKGFSGLLGFSLGGGAVAAGLMIARQAVNQFERSIHPAERAADRFGATMSRAMVGLGRDLSIGLGPGLDMLGKVVTTLEKGRKAASDWLGSLLSSDEQVGEVNAQMKAQQEQEATRKERDTTRKFDLEREQRLARVHNDGVRAARAEAELSMLAAKEKYAAAVAAGEMSGQAMRDQLAHDQELADLSVQRAEQEEQRRRETESQRVSDELNRRAEDKQRAEEEQRRNEETARKEALDKKRALEDARMDIARGAVDQLRAQGKDDEAKKLDIILDYRQRLLEIDRLEIDDANTLLDLRQSAEESMMAQLEAAGKARAKGYTGGSLDFSSGGAARSAAQVFGGTPANVTYAKKTTEILAEIKGVLQQINSKSGDAAAEYV